MRTKGHKRQLKKARMRAMYFAFFAKVGDSGDHVRELDSCFRAGLSERKTRDRMLSRHPELRS